MIYSLRPELLVVLAFLRCIAKSMYLEKPNDKWFGMVGLVLWFEIKFYKYFTIKNANKVSQHSVIHTCVTSSMWLSSKHATCFEFLQSHNRTYNEVIRMRSSTANQITMPPCQLTCRSPYKLTCILQTTMLLGYVYNQKIPEAYHL